MKADLLVHNASQVLTLASPSGPKRGASMAELGIISDGAIAIKDGRILDVGPSPELVGRVQARQRLDARGRVAMPGFVDPHTHVVWAGSRADEFEMRIGGASYMEIMAAGGGITNTVRHTRAATLQDLVSQTRPRLERMLAYGTTTAETKTGYGLATDDEIKQLRAIRHLGEELPLTLVPTFLGAHAIPAEYSDRPDEYVDLVIDEMLPAIVQDHRQYLPSSEAPAVEAPPLFCDVFCEDGAFSQAQSRRILKAARAEGLGLKIHVDEFKPLGGTALAVELGATSADHMVTTPPSQLALLAQSPTIAVSLPGTPFGLGHHDYTPARALIDAGGALALATDCNPGTCWCESMQFIIALACRAMRITPAEAISAATINAAHAVALGHEVGSLEPGKRADLVLLDAPAYQHLGYRFGTNLVAKVIAGGQIV